MTRLPTSVHERPWQGGVDGRRGGANVRAPLGDRQHCTHWSRGMHAAPTRRLLHTRFVLRTHWSPALLTLTVTMPASYLPSERSCAMVASRVSWKYCAGRTAGKHVRSKQVGKIEACGQREGQSQPRAGRHAGRRRPSERTACPSLRWPPIKPTWKSSDWSTMCCTEGTHGDGQGHVRSVAEARGREAASDRHQRRRWCTPAPPACPPSLSTIRPNPNSPAAAPFLTHQPQQPVEKPRDLEARTLGGHCDAGLVACNTSWGCLVAARPRNDVKLCTNAGLWRVPPACNSSQDGGLMRPCRRPARLPPCPGASPAKRDSDSSSTPTLACANKSGERR